MDKDRVYCDKCKQYILCTIEFGKSPIEWLANQHKCGRGGKGINARGSEKAASPVLKEKNEKSK